MAKAEVSWKSRDEEGIRREVYAKHIGDRWVFHVRERRFDEWKDMPAPPLDDWMELYDGVKRRAGRRLIRPEAVQQVRKLILERFPEADV